MCPIEFLETWILPTLPSPLRIDQIPPVGGSFGDTTFHRWWYVLPLGYVWWMVCLLSVKLAATGYRYLDPSTGGCKKVVLYYSPLSLNSYIAKKGNFLSSIISVSWDIPHIGKPIWILFFFFIPLQNNECTSLRGNGYGVCIPLSFMCNKSLLHLLIIDAHVFSLAT